MVGRVIIFETGYQTVSALQDLLELKLGTAQAGFFLSAAIMQYSDSAATEAELLPVCVRRASGSFTSGSGGGTATVIKNQTSDAAHGLATIERNNTTQAVVGSGALETLKRGVFNVLSGEWEYTPTVELSHPIGPSEALILSLDGNPSDALTLNAQVSLLITHG